VASFQRFRAADGFSHARALGFQLTLTLIPALIALIGFATVIDQQDIRDFVSDTLLAVAPGATGEGLTEAIRQGSARGEAGEAAVAFGVAAALAAGTVAMAQVERGANRIYGIERDRPALHRYARAAVLAVTAGTLVAAAMGVVAAGGVARRISGIEGELDAAWAIGRWPVGIALLTGAMALLFRFVPNRRQPETSWLAVGAGLAVLLWLGLIGALALFFDRMEGFGDTYGPLAGTIGLLVWAFLSAIALFLGLAFAAQLEAVRAGVPGPRRAVDTPDAAPAASP
jgi:YihY family inner membrane protein